MTTFVVALVGALSLLWCNAPGAGATVIQNTDWIASRMMQRSDGPMYTSGAWLLSRTNQHLYLWTVAHAVKNCQSCPVLGLQHLYESASNNWFDGAALVFPTNPAYAYYDMVLVDFGVSNVAKTNKIWNYCTATNCTSYQGFGTASNPNWAGSAYNQTGSAGSSAGWGVMAGKMASGTSWGTISSAYHFTNSGWDFWGIKVTGVTGCGNSPGDSGSPWYTGPTGGDLVGINVGAPSNTSWTVPGPSPCYGYTVSISDQAVYVDMASVVAAYPGFSLVAVTTP